MASEMEVDGDLPPHTAGSTLQRSSSAPMINLIAGSEEPPPLSNTQ